MHKRRLSASGAALYDGRLDRVLVGNKAGPVKTQCCVFAGPAFTGSLKLGVNIFLAKVGRGSSIRRIAVGADGIGEFLRYRRSANNDFYLVAEALFR